MGRSWKATVFMSLILTCFQHTTPHALLVQSHPPLWPLAQVSVVVTSSYPFKIRLKSSRCVVSRLTLNLSVSLSPIPQPSDRFIHLSLLPDSDEIWPGKDVAKKMTAIQSSTFLGAIASKAINGASDTNFNHGHCSLTMEQDNPWWRVELNTTTEVAVVKVLIRSDCCEADYEGFQVFVGDSFPFDLNEQCGGVQRFVEPGEQRVVQCSRPIAGKFVYIAIPDRSVSLSLCSVTVHAPWPAQGNGVIFSIEILQ